MKYRYSKHAVEQIGKRSISKEKIAIVIDKPALIITAYKTSKIEKYEDKI